MEIFFKQVSFRFNRNTSIETIALDQLDARIHTNQVTVILGESGSGKTTFVEHINALNLPQHGEVIVGDRHVHSRTKKKERNLLRKDVAIVFQFPESQFFEETALKEVMFPLILHGLSEEHAKKQAIKSLEDVQFPMTKIHASPFLLSGGEQRRLAIACALVREPDILILDEPTIGLDPLGKKDIVQLVKQMKYSKNRTIIMITHEFETVLPVIDSVLLMEHGKVVIHAELRDYLEWFVKAHTMEKAPLIYQLQREYEDRFAYCFPTTLRSIEEFVDAVQAHKGVRQ